VFDAVGTLYQVDLTSNTISQTYQVTNGWISSIQEDRQEPNIIWLTSTTKDGLVKVDRAANAVTSYTNIRATLQA